MMVDQIILIEIPDLKAAEKKEYMVELKIKIQLHSKYKKYNQTFLLEKKI
jgi:hypothetical protein